MTNGVVDTFRAENFLVTVCHDTVTQVVAVDALDDLFACRVDGQHQQNIRLIERTGEVIEQCLGPRIPVRLKYHHFSSVRPGILKRLECRFDLGGVVPIIIHYGNTVQLAFDFQSPLDTFGLFKCRLNDGKGDIQLKSDGNARHGIGDTVVAWQVEVYFSKRFSLKIDIKSTFQSLKTGIFGLHIRLRAHAIGDKPFPDSGNEFLNMLVVQAEYP